MTSLQFEIMTGQSRLPAIRAAIEKVLQAYKRLATVTLSVERSIMPGVTIVFGSSMATVKEPIKGPVSLALDDSGSIVMKSPTSGTATPLASKAKLRPAPDSVDLDELARWLDNPALAGASKPPKAA